MYTVIYVQCIWIYRYMWIYRQLTFGFLGFYELIIGTFTLLKFTSVKLSKIEKVSKTVRKFRSNTFD